MGITENPGLKAFIEISKTGSVHSAAKSLGLTQTAVTKRLQALEAELSLTLFIRSRRGMSLTEDGVALLQHCRAVNELEGLFLSRIAGEKRAEVNVTIIGPTSALSTRIVESCKPIYQKYPYLRLHLRSDDDLDRIDLIRRGEAEFAIVPPENIPNEMESKVLKPDRYYLVGTPSWKGRRLTDILENERIIDFYEDDPTTRNYLKHFELAGQVNKSRLYVNENAALINLFCAGIGYGTLTDTVARPYLETGKLIALNKAQAMDDPLALVWYPRTQRPDYFSDIIHAIK